MSLKPLVGLFCHLDTELPSEEAFQKALERERAALLRLESQKQQPPQDLDQDK